MRLKEVYVEGYRSLRQIKVQLEPLTVLVGRNAVGKTNLYRSLNLLQAAADGSICRRLAEEGGIGSVLWAGPANARSKRLVLGAIFEGLEYRIEIGLPGPGELALNLEPMVRYESLKLTAGGIDIRLLERKGPSLWLKSPTGPSEPHQRRLLASETALASIRDGAHYPELALLRQVMLEWRFYHDARTDDGAPLRRPSLGLSVPTLSSDGHDLASVLATVYYVKNEPQPIVRAINEAFPGCELVVSAVDGMCKFGMKYPETDRVFAANELSDGTLRYLYMVGALLGYRLPLFIAINEPEVSMHPDLLDPLGRLIVQAAEKSQIWIVTHSESLAAQLARHGGAMPRVVTRENGATQVGEALHADPAAVGWLEAAAQQ